MTEDQLETDTLSWLAKLGYVHRHGADITPDSATPERSDYLHVLLRGRLGAAIQKLNPSIRASAGDDALAQVLDLGTPALLSANRVVHKLLVCGVPVPQQKDGEMLAAATETFDEALT